MDIIADLLVKLRDDKIRTIEPRRTAEEYWKKVCQDISNMLLFRLNDTSWYLGTNIPGKKKEQLLYLGGILAYNGACKDGLKDWSNFEVKHEDGSGVKVLAENMPQLKV